MLEREEELRMSQTTIESYKKARKLYGENGVINIIENIQKQVSWEFGVTPEFIRSLDYIYRDDKEFLEKIKSISHYRRHNIMIDGNLNENDIAPQIKLYNIKTKKKKI